jgi:thioredoxin 2
LETGQFGCIFDVMFAQSYKMDPEQSKSDILHIACPHCAAINRLHPQRLQDHPNCGQCRQPLFTGHPAELTTTRFVTHLTRNDIPLLVDFWAPWCGPCKMMAPQFEQAARLLEPRVRLVKVNTEKEPGLASQYGIRSIPTLVLFKGGHESARQPGAMGASDIVRWTERYL